MSQTRRLALPIMQPSQAQKHVTHNEALQVLDAVVQLRLLSIDAQVPPAAPEPGDAHAVGAGAAGAWAGREGRIASWDGTGWVFIAPEAGWAAWDAAGSVARRFRGGAWVPEAPDAAEPPDQVEGLGVNAAWDETSRLAVSAAATLLSHEGAGHQVKVNKAAPGDTASLLFQSGWTGHAEMGLAGDLDFSVKVGDGASWREALRVARATGVVALPAGATIGGTLGGAAVQATPTDTAPGRLMAVGAFGLGGLLPVIGNAAVLDGTVAPGLWCFDTSLGSSGGPGGATRGMILHGRRVAGGGETQLMVVESGTGGAYAGALFSRARGAGAWSAWMAGSVQSSAGNGNGRFVRGQDGTQTCWHSLDTSATAETTWTFPATFPSTTRLAIQATPVSTAPGLLAPRIATRTGSAATLSVLDAQGARVAATVDLLAIGRWY